MDYPTLQNILVEIATLSKLNPDLRSVSNVDYGNTDNENNYHIEIWDRDREKYMITVETEEEFNQVKPRLLPNQFQTIQREVGQWSRENFGDQASWKPLLGIGEELGELQHHYLKREQGIRGTAEEHNAGIEDATADIMIFMMDFCCRENIDLFEVLDRTWTKIVKKRNWTQNKTDGINS